MADRPVVAIVTRPVPNHRVPFYEGLRAELDERGIDLHLLQGVANEPEDKRNDGVILPWAATASARIFELASTRVVWQSLGPAVHRADLVVVPQQTKLLAGHLLMARQILGRQHVALWGHGRNFQAKRPDGARAAVKRWLSRQPHWWFAYNALSAQIVSEFGFPAHRITEVQNAIDTRSLVAASQGLTDVDLQRLRTEHGIDLAGGGHVCVYAGGLYDDKQLDVLVASSDRIRERVPDFELIVIGGGVDEPFVRASAATRPWLHYVGQRFGSDKVPFFALSKLLLMPGLVGLAVLDAFALGTPLVTLSDSPHSPEIAYLENGRNGVIVDAGAAGGDRVEAFASAVGDILLDERRRARLVEGCHEARRRYTVEEMVRRYADGVEHALGAPPRRSRTDRGSEVPVA